MTQDPRQWAKKFVVFGHTHHHEIVALDDPIHDGKPVEQIYVNSGTWRAVHELAQAHPGKHRFLGFHVMTYLAFFKDDERKRRGSETWSGALGKS